MSIAVEARPAAATDALLIWWTDQFDAEAVWDDKRRYQLPKYLREQFADRHGRNGRGRLWCDAGFGRVAVEPWPTSDLAMSLAARYAGIVIHRRDAAKVSRLHGIVTDFALNPAH